MIDLLVRPVPPVVLPQVFDGSDGQDEDHRSQGQLGLERVDDRHEVEQRDENEVDVGEPVELFEQILGQEGEQGVLGRLNLVVCIVSVRVFLPFGVVVEYVCVHGSGFALFEFLLSLPFDFRIFGHRGVFALSRHSLALLLHTAPQVEALFFLYVSCPLTQNNKHKVAAM